MCVRVGVEVALDAVAVDVHACASDCLCEDTYTCTHIYIHSNTQRSAPGFTIASVEKRRWRLYGEAWKAAGVVVGPPLLV